MGRKVSKGFTMVELLVTMSIISLLTAISLATFSGAREKARDARRVSDMRQIRNALELYNTQNGDYPTNLQALVSAGHISEISNDPKNEATTCRPTYCFATADTSGGQRTYHIGIQLEQNNSVLISDADCSSVAPATCVGGASYSGVLFDGADAGKIYDLIP